MEKEELKKKWIESMDQDTFLTPKHDPNNLSTTYNSYRTVLSNKMSSSLYQFINSGNYEIIEYDDNRYGNKYYEIKSNTSKFNLTGGGVPAQAMYTSSRMDRLAIVSGSDQGWHCFAEHSNTIQNMINANNLVLSSSPG